MYLSAPEPHPYYVYSPAYEPSRHFASGNSEELRRVRFMGVQWDKEKKQKQTKIIYISLIFNLSNIFFFKIIFYIIIYFIKFYDIFIFL